MREYFVHPQGICESEHIGAGTRIWAFAHVLPDAIIGKDCNICDHAFIENDVVVGDRVTIKCGVQLWDGLRVEDDVFIGPNATFSNDRFPRSKQRPEQFARTVVERRASVGANATILPGISIGQNAMVGAGAVVTHDVPPNAIVVGNPARIVGYADTGKALRSKRAAATFASDELVHETQVAGVTLHRLKLVRDMRGSLSVGEFEKDIPFVSRRYFFVFDVPSAEVRGEHAHYKCHQFLVCARGQVSVVADDGSRREEYLLDSSDIGIYLPPMVWGIQYRYSPDAVLCVFASDPYDANDYIRNYDDFLTIKRGSGTGAAAGR